MRIQSIRLTWIGIARIDGVQKATNVGVASKYRPIVGLLFAQSM